MNSGTNTGQSKGWKTWLHETMNCGTVELTVGGLIVISVSLTFVEMSMSPAAKSYKLVEDLNHLLTIIFAIELSLRGIAAPSKKEYLRTYWIDILSVLPLLRMFRIFRALRLLRLLRIFRLMGIFTRYVSYFPYVLRRGALEYIIVLGLILIAILFGSATMLAFEREANEQLDSLTETFWFSIYSLFAGEPIPNMPKTDGGKFASIFVMFLGMTFFAMLTGTVSAYMIERIQGGGRTVNLIKLENHIIICGWSRKAEIIINEYQSAHRNSDIVVITLEEEGELQMTDPSVANKVTFLHDDFTKVSVLERAGISKASTCIILCDRSHNRSEQDADARTILAALTAEKLNPEIYTCAELINREFGSHLEMGQVNDYVIADEQSAFLLAQAALNRGLVHVVSELLTHERGNQFYTLDLPDDWAGKSFLDLFIHIKKEKNAILLAVQSPDGSSQVNPTDYEFKEGDVAVVIASESVEL
ncbi:MAG: ion transporter [Planctomycetota bacterium]|jgi:voltage-gated potassium channel|nr:ion transporter [Planctomycetota bacterium]MDP7133516.1 ion transporter [Planctomycetota bacterium]MDP7250819.1 ion transporter [Planctomycetota bacterium]